MTLILLAFSGVSAAQTCTFTFSPTQGSPSASGGNYTVTVTASSSTCVRPTPVSNVDWITISFGGGTGNGTFGYTVKANNSVSSRTGTITHGSQTYTVTQAASTCSFSFSSGTTSATFNSAGGSGNFSITASAAECQWTATSPASWISISTPSGTGNGTVSYTVAANTSAQRNDIISVGGLSFNVIQRAPCTYSVAPTSIAAGPTETLGTIQITPSDQSCTWSITSLPSWVSITYGSSGTGNGTAGYRVAANNSPSPRSGQFLVAGIPVAVTQDGGACSYSLSTTLIDAPSMASSGVISVTAASGCSWQAISNVNWASFSGAATGSGNGSVTYSIQANTSGQARSGTFTIAGITVQVNQDTGSCTYTVSPSSVEINVTFAVQAAVSVTAQQGCSWTASSGATWITLTSGSSSGNGSGTVGFNVTANATGPSRTGNLNVAGQVIPVTQAGLGCNFVLTPSSFAVGADGGTVAFAINAPGCPWTVSPNVGWIRVVPPSTGSGNGSASVAVDSNPTSTPRTGTVTVGTAQVMVSQAGRSCNVTIAPTIGTFPANGAPSSFLVTAPDACVWSVTADSNWITITDSGPGMGSGEVFFRVESNPTAQARTASIAVGGAIFTARQNAAACTFSLAPSSASFPPAGGNGVINVSTNCDWKVATAASWITVSTQSAGTGNTNINYSVQENTATQSRSGVITVNDTSFQVTQAGKGCNVALAPTADRSVREGATGSFKVTSSAGCDWSPSSSADWLTIVSYASASGSGSVNYKTAFNPIDRERTATVTVAGQTFTLTQAAGGPMLANNGVLNGASFLGGAVAPGEMVSIFGQGLGPTAFATYTLTPDNTRFTTSLGGTRVLFDGVPAPIVATSDGQVNAIVPYEVDGKTKTNLMVEYNGILSQALSLDVTPYVPALFTVDRTGSGQAAIINWDADPKKWVVNSSTNAAARSGYIMIFATGEGQTTPGGVNGLIAASATLPKPKVPVTVQIGGRDATVTYYGAAPGIVAGMFQINCQVPAAVTPGNAVSVVIRMGAKSSQTNVTMAVK